MAAVFVLADVLDLGHNTRLLRDLVRATHLTDWYRSSFLPKIVFAIIASLVWCGLVAGLGGPASLMILGAPLIGHVAGQSLLVVLRVQQRTALVATVQAGERTLALLATAVLLTAHVPLKWLVPIAFFIGQLSVVTLSAFAIRNSLEGFRVAPRFDSRLFHSWRFCFMMLLTDSAQLNILFVSWIAGSTVGGVFSAAVRITSVFAVFVYSGVTFLLPRLSHPRNRNDNGHNGVVAILLVVTLASLSLALTAPSVVRGLLGPRYVDTVVPLILLSLAAIPSACSQLGGIFLIAFGREGVLLRIHAAFALSGILAVSLGAALEQQDGAAVASTCNTLLAAIIVLLYCRSRPSHIERMHSPHLESADGVLKVVVNAMPSSVKLGQSISRAVGGNQ
jgi:O-antigen/teichoic acid export membrane protein